MPHEYQNFIAGKWRDSSSGKQFEVRNPAHWDEIIGTFPNSTEKDVNAAVRSAREALQDWRKTPAPVRGEILKNVGDLMSEQKEELARLMTRENGKVLNETRGDVQEGIDTAYYAFGEGRRFFGHTVPSELPNKTQFTRRRAVGVAGIITAWNFPIAVPTWKIFPALLCGNTIVFKPAEDTPASAVKLIELLVEAGVPAKAVNLVHGAGDVGSMVVEHPDVDLIAFTGSAEVGKIINEKAGAMLKRVSLELGSKNSQIVMDDANLDLALDGALWGAYGTTGQRCTATSRLILQEGIHDEFVDRVIAEAKKIKLGDGLDESVEVGPVISEAGLEKIRKYVEIGQQEGAHLRLGGEVADGDSLGEGWFFKPTVFTGVTPEMRIAQEEIFGPVLSVLKVKTLDEAIEVINNVEYGLSSSIYTQDVNAAFNAMHEIDFGITYINGPTIGAEVHMPFGGTRNTGNGHRESGWEVYDFYTETQTIYIDHSGTLQRAQIDNR